MNAVYTYIALLIPVKSRSYKPQQDRTIDYIYFFWNEKYEETLFDLCRQFERFIFLIASQ